MKKRLFLEDLTKAWEIVASTLIGMEGRSLFAENYCQFKVHPGRNPTRSGLKHVV